MSPRRSWDPAPGADLVPGWTALAPLGGGRRTEAWRCADDDRLAVVKVLRPGRTGPDDVAMLRAEAEAYRDAAHPMFPALLAEGLDDDPAWLAFEHVDGMSLDTLVATAGPLDLDQALPLAASLATGLAHLHARGRVHLDVKPSNVVLAAVPRLLDLGASRTVEAAREAGAGIGTWHSRAPEQQDPGRFGALGPATDVWGMAVTVLHAVTGEEPLRARRDDADEEEVAAAARGATDRTPGPLRAVLRACLATAPAERPDAASVADMVAASRPPDGVVSRLGRALRGRRG